MIVFEDTVSYFETEDNGHSKIAEIDDPNQSQLFLRLHSWNRDSNTHPELDDLIGKKVRVTLEVIE